MSLRYAYANARVKGMKTNLLDDATVTELTRVKTVDEVVALLQQTPYKNELVEASKAFEGVTVVDEALHRNLAKTVRKLWRILPKKEKPAFESFTAEWDAQNFKKIISNKEIGAAIEDKDLNVVCPEREPLLAKMRAAANAREAARLLACAWGSPEFRKAVSAEVEECSKPGKRRRFGKAMASRTERAARKKKEAETEQATALEFDFRRVIREIEKERVRQLASVSKQGDDLTRKTMHNIMEFQSIMLSLRLKREGENFLSGEDAEELGVKEFFFESKAAKLVGAAENYFGAVREALDYYGLKDDAGELAEKPLSHLEIKLERGLVEKILKNTRLSVLSFAAIIGFLYLKIVEVGNLRKIAFATSFGLKEEMKDFVYAVNF